LQLTSPFQASKVMWSVAPAALALVFVATGSIDMKEVDPYTARVEWPDGKVETIHAQNRSFCEAIAGKIRDGLWRPAQREGMVPVVVCQQGGPYTGGACIKGYVGPRPEGHCK